MSGVEGDQGRTGGGGALRRRSLLNCGMVQGQCWLHLHLDGNDWRRPLLWRLWWLRILRGMQFDRHLLL